jgi:hypothetical protein
MLSVFFVLFVVEILPVGEPFLSRRTQTALRIEYQG